MPRYEGRAHGIREALQAHDWQGKAGKCEKQRWRGSYQGRGRGTTRPVVVTIVPVDVTSTFQ